MIVVDAMASLHAQAELVLLGAPGPRDPSSRRWIELAQSAGISLKFTGTLPASELSRRISGSDVILHANLEGPSSRKGTLAAALAHARPVVAIDGPNRWAALLEAGAVRTVEPSRTDIAGALDELAEMPGERERLGQAGAQFYSLNMSLRMVGDRFAALLPVSRASGRARRLAIVVNRAGIQENRANAVAALLDPEFEVRVVVSASSSEVWNAARWADLMYIIDPGKKGFPAAALGRLKGRPVVVEMGDPQGPLYRAQGRASPAVLTGALMDALVARRATGVVVRGRRLAEDLGVRVPWIEVPDGVDIDVFRPLPVEDLRRSLGLSEETLVVGLTGSLQMAGRPPRTYGWDIVDALAHLRDQPVRGLIVGDGPGRAWLQRRASDLGVADRLLLPGRVAHAEVPRYISAMDVCVSTQSNDLIGRARTTAKLPEYLACDRYVLATMVGGAVDVLPPEMLCPYQGSHDVTHPERLARRLAALVPRRAELSAGAGTRSIACARYAYPMLADRLVSFFRELGVA
ncbi:MAG TPA: glycosyltransferase [Acidimicrobiales bacterium]|nr:glycosyltransferase [Acidimicrobiales bacterium]